MNDFQENGEQIEMSIALGYWLVVVILLSPLTLTYDISKPVEQMAKLILKFFGTIYFSNMMSM